MGIGRPAPLFARLVPMPIGVCATVEPSGGRFMGPAVGMTFAAGRLLLSDRKAHDLAPPLSL